MTGTNVKEKLRRKQIAQRDKMLKRAMYGERGRYLFWGGLVLSVGQRSIAVRVVCDEEICTEKGF